MKIWRILLYPSDRKLLSDKCQHRVHSGQSTMERRPGAKHSPVHPTFCPWRISSGTKMKLQEASHSGPIGMASTPSWQTSLATHPADWWGSRCGIQQSLSTGHSLGELYVIQCWKSDSMNSKRFPRPVLGRRVLKFTPLVNQGVVHFIY